MKMFFSAGKNKRLAIDTSKRTWNNNYFYLGGHRHYIKISVSDFAEIMEEIKSNGYEYDENF